MRKEELCQQSRFWVNGSEKHAYWRRFAAIGYDLDVVGGQACVLRHLAGK